MTYIIAEPCVDLLDKACIEECPVDCIYEGNRMLYIHPDECVDCGACEPVCPVEAIFYEDDVPEQWKDYTTANYEFFEDLGSPGGASKVGKIDKDDAVVAAQPPRAKASTDQRCGCRPALPDFPVGPAGAGQGGRRRPPGRPRRPVHRHAGRPGARGASGGAGGGRRRARLPADRRHARRCARRSGGGWPGACGATVRRRSACCRRSAPRSWSPGCRRCSASAPATPWSIPSVCYPTYEVGRPAGRRRRSCGPTRCSRSARRRRQAGLGQLARQPDRPGAAGGAPAQGGRLGARARRGGRQRRVLPAAGLGGRARRRSCRRRSAAARSTACSRCTRCRSGPTSPATGPGSWPATRRWSRELLAVRKHAGMIVPAPVQAAMVAALDDEAVGDRAARPLRRPARACCARRWTKAGFAVDHSEAGPLPVGHPRRGLLVHRGLAGRSAGILVAPGDFYGPAGERHVRVALTATDERVAARPCPGSRSPSASRLGCMVDGPVVAVRGEAIREVPPEIARFTVTVVARDKDRQATLTPAGRAGRARSGR